jgi:hypothetical protein
MAKGGQFCSVATLRLKRAGRGCESGPAAPTPALGLSPSGPAGPGQDTLPKFTSKFSRKDFTLPQLFACLVLKEFEKKDYRGVS